MSERADGDLPDLVFFMLATGVPIDEALALVWADVDLLESTGAITRMLTRVKGEGLLRSRRRTLLANAFSDLQRVRWPRSALGDDREPRAMTRSIERFYTDS